MNVLTDEMIAQGCENLATAIRLTRLASSRERKYGKGLTDDEARELEDARAHFYENRGADAVMLLAVVRSSILDALESTARAFRAEIEKSAPQYPKTSVQTIERDPVSQEMTRVTTING